ncbi:MAG TPA: YciI family protein [Myxococcaceae bacterium]|nr:YciI family protein [Myxococcaceae bacterium]
MRRWAIAVSMGGLVAATAVWAAEKANPPPMKDVPKDMRTYYVVFLLAGPRFAPDSPERAALMPNHLAFIRKMISEKKLRLAGPFADQGKLFGIAIVDAPSAEQAKAWMEQDPAVQAGFFAHEMHPAKLPALDSLRVRY